MTAVWLSVLATMAAATVFTAQPAEAAEEELIILSYHDSTGAVRDAVAAMEDKDKGLRIVPTEGQLELKTFYSSYPEHPEEGFDSTCAGVDFSESNWYGTMALIIAGDKTFNRIIYRKGAAFDSNKEIKKVFASTVQHGYFRTLLEYESMYAPAGSNVRATGSGDPPSDTEAVVCVVWVKL
jgi:hypothetical protein